jgi:hypothetical protein
MKTDRIKLWMAISALALLAYVAFVICYIGLVVVR